MELDAKTQAFVDGLISKKYAEAHAKAEAKAAEQLAAAEAKHAEEVNTLKAENEKFKAAQGESNERVRKALLRAEIAGSGAVNEIQVAKLVNENIAIGDDGELKVVDEKGLICLDEAGRPLTVKTYLEGFLKDNSHLAKAAPSMGAGSMGSTSFSGMGATSMRRRDFDALDDSRKTTFVRSGGHIKD